MTSLDVSSFPAAISLICGLLRGGSPSAIFRAVGAFVVNSVNRQMRFCLSHVRKKTLKTKPAFADRNASAAVTQPIDGVRVFASLSHCIPNVIGATARHTVGLVAPWKFRFPASTTVGVPASQIPCSVNANIAARALASPINNGSPAFGSTTGRHANSGEAAKGAAAKVVRYCHASLYVGIKYDIA